MAASEPGTAEPQDRAALRRVLLDLRVNHPARDEADTRIHAALDELLGRLAVRCLAFYWPVQGEFDARPAVARWLAAAPGRRAALPAVSRPAAPLDFHVWAPDTAMRAGRYGIPVPDGTDAATPDALLIPCVGFSPEKFRLGYGGGFYDRTLAALAAHGDAAPLAIGVAYESSRVALDAQVHDIAMDWLVTDGGVL